MTRNDLVSIYITYKQNFENNELRNFFRQNTLFFKSVRQPVWFVDSVYWRQNNENCDTLP